MRAYVSAFRMRWKMEKQYRGAVIGGFVCQLLFGLILVGLYRALYFSKPQPYPIGQVSTYVWLQQAFFRMLLATDSDLMDKIRTGSIAYDLCRPVRLYGFYYARIMAQKLLGSLMRGIPMLVFAALLPEGWGLLPPDGIGALLAAIAGLLLGLLCMCALENITVACTMRTLDSRGMQSMMTLLVMVFSGNVLPLTLFPDSWQQVITALPFAQLLDAPIRLYLGQAALSSAWLVLLRQAAWAVILIAAGSFFWYRNQKRMIVQGG